MLLGREGPASAFPLGVGAGFGLTSDDDRGEIWTRGEERDANADGGGTVSGIEAREDDLAWSFGGSDPVGVCPGGEVGLFEPIDADRELGLGKVANG